MKGKNFINNVRTFFGHCLPCCRTEEQKNKMKRDEIRDAIYQNHAKKYENKPLLGEGNRTRKKKTRVRLYRKGL